MEEVTKGVNETQFGTAYEIYKDAVKKYNIIKLKHVKYCLSSHQDKQTHFKYNYNSFVSPGANFEYEVDLMDLGTNVPEYRYGSLLWMGSQKWQVSYPSKTNNLMNL